MRKLIILFVGIALAQPAFANSQCTLKPGHKIHCANCVTLEQFAFYGASALYAVNPSQKSILVTGSNGSDVSVGIGLAWNDFNFSLKLGRLGEFGADVPYPSIYEAEVTAYDINHRVAGQLPNSGRFSYSALKAKCNQIQAEREKAQERMDYAEALWERYGAAVENNHGTGRGWRGIPWARATGSRIIPPDDCSNCRAEEIEVHRE